MNTFAALLIYIMFLTYFSNNSSSVYTNCRLMTSNNKINFYLCRPVISKSFKCLFKIISDLG